MSSLSLADFRSPEKQPPPPSSHAQPLHRSFGGGGGGGGGVSGELDFTFGQLQLQPLPSSRHRSPASNSFSGGGSGGGLQPQSSQQSHVSSLTFPSGHYNINGVEHGNLSRSASPSQQYGMSQLDSSFRSGGGGGGGSPSRPSPSSSPRPHGQSVSVMSEMLQKAREALQRLQLDLDSERSRRQAAEREVVDVRRELSNERLAGSSSVQQQQMQQDREARLMRELAAQKEVETSLRSQLQQEIDLVAQERSDCIRLEEKVARLESEVRATQDALRARQQDLIDARRSHAMELARRDEDSRTHDEVVQQLREEVATKSAALKDTEAIMQQIELQLNQMEAQRTQRENQRKKEVQEHTAQLDAVRQENERLTHLLHQQVTSMRAQWEEQYTHMQSTLEDKITSLQARLSELHDQEHKLARIVHEAAISNASLTERLDGKTAELLQVQSQLQELKTQHALERSEQAREISQLKERHAAELRQLERSHTERLAAVSTQQQQALDAATRSDFERLLQTVEREVERTVLAGISSATDKAPANGTTTSTAGSPSASALDLYASSASFSPSSSLSASRSAVFSPSRSTSSAAVLLAASTSSTSNSSGSSNFYTTLLSHFHERLLHRLESAFGALRSQRERVSHEHRLSQSTLQAEVASLKDRVRDLQVEEKELIRTWQTKLDASALELREAQQSAQQERLVSHERGLVIRELKKRYKVLQGRWEVAQQQIIDLDKQRVEQLGTIHSLRERSERALQSSLGASSSEKMSARRLESEQKLRRKTEEEAERYVQTAQQAQRQVVALQQEKADLLTFFRQHIREVTQMKEELQPSKEAQPDSETRFLSKLHRFMANRQHSLAAIDPLPLSSAVTLSSFAKHSPSKSF